MIHFLITYLIISFTLLMPLSFASAQDGERLFQLSHDDAEIAIAEALISKGAGDNLSANIQSKKGDVLFSYGMPVSAEIHDLSFDHNRRSWSANILFISEKKVVSAIPASGRFNEIVEVPVLIRSMSHRQVIREDDIEMRSLPLANIRDNTTMHKDELIGKSPARHISANRPIRDTEVKAPTVIKKNSLIQLHYDSVALHISTAGKATEDGAIGDVISVRNLNSNRIIQAVVESAGHARVIAPGNIKPQKLATTDHPDTGERYATN